MDRENVGLIFMCVAVVGLFGGVAYLLKRGSATTTVPAPAPVPGTATAAPPPAGFPANPYAHMVQDLTQAIEVEPSAASYRARAQRYEQFRMTEAALADYAAAAAVDPADRQSLRALCRLGAAADDHTAVIEAATRLIELEPESSDHYVRRGVAGYHLGRYDDAERDLTAALARGAGASTRGARARSRFAAGDFQGAHADYHELVTAGHGEYRQGRGATRFHLHDYEGAAADFDRALRARPRSPQLLADRARLRLATGELEAALEDASLALTHADMTDASIYRVRAAIRRGMEQFDEARADIEQARRINGRDAGVYRDRAWIHWAAGNPAAAIPDFEKALTLRPADLHGHFGLGVMHYHLERWADAAAALDRAVKCGGDDATYAELYRFLAHTRAGERPRAHTQLAEFATRRSETASDPDAWPAPIIDFMLGRVDEVELLTVAAISRVQPTRARLCEARFFAGARRQLDGDEPGARQLFREAVETRATTFYEYLSAKTELED